MIKLLAMPGHISEKGITGVDYARVVGPMEALGKHKDFEVDILTPEKDEKSTVITWLKRAKKYDIFFLNYNNNPTGFAAMACMAKKEGKTIICDLDDSLWDIKPDNTAFQAFKKGSDGLSVVTAILRESDYVTCTNSYLKNVICHNTNKTHDYVKVFPNYIDLELYKYPVGAKDENTITIMHFGCFDDKTEILTESGFKLFKDLKRERVATLNRNTGFLEYQKPIKKFEYKFNGELLCAEGEQFSYAVTPNHQLYAKRLGGNCKLVKAEDIYGKNFFLKKDAKWKGKRKKYLRIGDKNILVEDWIKFFGFWIADGWTSKSKFKQKTGNICNCMQVGISQSKENNYLEKLYLILSKMGYKPKYTKDKKQVRMFDKSLWKYMLQFGGAEDKHIPNYLKDLPTKQLEILLDWYIKGDGHIEKCGRIRATTISKRLVDDLTEIALKVGWSTNFYNRETKDCFIGSRIVKKSNCHQCYNISFLRNTGKKNCLGSHVFPKHQSKKKYNGYVYDVEVPNHTLYVRKNGKCMWSGNSTSHFQDLQDGAFHKGMDKLMKEYPNIVFKTVGAYIPGYKHRWGQRYTHSYGDPDLYTWVKDKFPEFMKEADIIVAPLEEDVYTRCKSSIKFIEASSAKKPGVWQNIRQYNEIVNGENGLLARSEDEWYKAMKSLVDSFQLRKDMGEKAHETVVKNWQLKHHLKDYASFYKEVLDKK